jgi:hypothetical protein
MGMAAKEEDETKDEGIEKIKRPKKKAERK